MSGVISHSLFSEFDVSLFQAGKHFRLYEKFGAHPLTLDGVDGVYFAVWAPSAKLVSVIGDFNLWNGEKHPLQVRWDSSGIWEGFIPAAKKGMRYKYKIVSNLNDMVTEKSDPYALYYETPPKTASIIWNIDDYPWRDKKWMSYRKDKNGLDRPYSVYELHLGSWKHHAEEHRSLSYQELAKELVAYVKEMNFTHIELMPVMEYPYDPSWGYQLVGYFAPTSRFGLPQDFMRLIDEFHRHDIGVILDWVPSHFPDDAHGLGFFDGSNLYEHPDRKKGYHPDWKSLIFNYERNEVRSFLISNALFWLEHYHIDGLRVDAVASMIYLDYSREDGQWEANEHGGRENLAAISFLQDFNDAVYSNYEGVQTIAEESTAFPNVTQPAKSGGLGFGMKWMMGWMHDTLNYFARDPIYRTHHQNDITFSLTYAFSEHFLLPLSHDEVVYGKRSILGRMPGDDWQRFANLRLLYAYMFTHPGTKLLFMGSEFGQWAEWNFQKGLDWYLLQFDLHEQMRTYVKALNGLYTSQPSLYEKAFSHEGFKWINLGDYKNSVLTYLRKGHDVKNDIVVVCNFTSVVREHYKIGIPRKGTLIPLFNSDDKEFGGSGVSNPESIKVVKKPRDGMDYSTEITLPPLGAALFLLK